MAQCAECGADVEQGAELCVSCAAVVKAVAGGGARSRGELASQPTMRANDSHVRVSGGDLDDYEEEEDEETLPEGTLLGSYRIVKLLGKGGIGHVYLAEHAKLGRKVALKTLRKQFATNKQIVKRFFAEARAVNQINHDHIVEITDFVEDAASGAYLIMELLEGHDLAHALEREGVMPLSRSLPILKQVASALAAAHDAGIVHRDLKPENVFLAKKSGQKDYVKLLDFGIAKLTTKASKTGSVVNTAVGSVLGTPAYMSPEQACGHSVDARTDVYAFGIIAFEMITGELPIKGATMGEYVINHSTVAPPRPSAMEDLPHHIPSDLEEIVLRCLEKSPDARPSSMREIEAGLDALIGLGPALDVKAPRTARASGAVKKPSQLWIPMVAIALGVCLGVGVAVWAFAGGEEETPAVPRAVVREPPALPPPQPEPEPEPPPGIEAPAPPTSVAIHFESTPPGAEVRREGASDVLGTTPFTLTEPRGEGTQRFELRLEGHQLATTEVSLAQDGTANVVLSPEPARARREPRREQRRLNRTSVLNPF